MPIATATEYRAALDRALDTGYALAAVNVTSSQTLNAAIRGFADAGADGIVQITTSGALYASGSAEDMALGARAIAEYAHALAERAPVFIALHTDHCRAEHLDEFVRPLLAESLERRRRGEGPLFNSHMFDGSDLPIDENLRIASELLEKCR